LAIAKKGQLKASEVTLKQQQIELGKNISQIEKKAGFDTNKIKNRLSELTSVQNRQKSKLHARNILYTQQEEAKKYEINHEEKFRQFFQTKLHENQSIYHSSLPAQKRYFKKLVNFDKHEIQKFEDREKDHNADFLKLQEEDFEKISGEADRISRIQAKIAGLRLKLNIIAASLEWKLRSLNFKHFDIKDALEESLDTEKGARGGSLSGKIGKIHGPGKKVFKVIASTGVQGMLTPVGNTGKGLDNGVKRLDRDLSLMRNKENQVKASLKKMEAKGKASEKAIKGQQVKKLQHDD